MTAAGSELRLRQLDGLRAIAIGLVLVEHLWLQKGDRLAVLPLGYFGVSLFFVLSGYLITRVLLDARDRCPQRPSRQLWPFFARRFLRIVPPYALMLAALYAFDLQRTRERIWWHATYTSNWLFAEDAEFYRGGYDRHLWSLSVEEQFYLVWPLVILLLPRRWVTAAVVATFAAGPAWRAWALLMDKPPNWTLLTTPANADLLAAGGLVAIVGLRRGWAWALALLAVPAAIYLSGDHGNWLIGPRMTLNTTVLAIGLAGVVSLASTGVAGPIGFLLSLRPMVGVGVCSYGAYLVHTSTGPLARWVFGDDADRWLISSSATLFTLGIAWASWLSVERPILFLKRRVPYRETACPPSSVT